MPDKHAIVGTSSSGIWTQCPRSVRLGLTVPEEDRSAYAEEGTKAHSICEAKLKKLLGVRTRVPKAADQEMETCTTEYRDFVEEEWNSLKSETPDADLYIEQMLDLSEWIPEGFGTSDAVIVSDTKLVVIDFKYGKGVMVNAENNPQLRLYALGAWKKFGIMYDFDSVKTIIFQPRLGNISSEDIALPDLLKWGDDYIKPRARLAYDGEGEFKVGEHCRFCRAGAVCRARAEQAFQIINHDKVDPPLLSDEEIPPILDKLDSTEAWISAIRAYAKNKAVNEGVKWEGYKLVEGRTQRKITDQVKALEALEKAGFDVEDVTTLKLKGLTDLERIMTKPKFNEVLADYVVKPKGEPTLVREDDKRPEYNPVQEVFKEDI